MSQSKKEGSGTQERVKPAPPRPPKKGIGDVLSEGPNDVNKQPTQPGLLTPETPEEAAGRLEKVLTAKFAEQGYTFIAKIGSGGMGSVFLARDDALDREVAIKVMNDDMFGNREARTRFFKEARALAKMNHPNITIIYKLYPDEKDGYSFIVQELLNGKDMNQMRYEKGSLEPEAVQALFIQACEGFATAHEAGIIHRDIKPENLFVIGSNGKQTVKIMDFGVAKVEDNKHGPSFRTQVGVIMGSVDYFSPEQAEGRVVDKRADIYSLGATMYEMATGSPPFGSGGDSTTPAEHFSRIFPKIMRETPALPSKMVPLKGIPEGLDSIIMRCLEKDPADRYQSMTELQDALRRLKIEPKPKPKAVETPVVADLPSILVAAEIRGVEVDGRKRSAMAVEAGVVRPIPVVPAEGDEIAAGQADAEKKAGMKTLIKQFGPDKNRRMKRIATAAVISAVVGLGALTGVAIVRSNGRAASPQAQTTSDARAGIPNSRETQAPRPVIPELVPIPPLVPLVASVDAGVAETASAAAPEAGPAVEVRTFEISIRTGLAGVEVLEGDNRLCVTDASGACSVSYGTGNEQVRLRFRKRGFTDAERTFVPDSDRAIEVSLERAPALRPGTRPPVKQGGRPGNAPPTGTGPTITSED